MWKVDVYSQETVVVWREQFNSQREALDFRVDFNDRPGPLLAGDPYEDEV